MLCNAVFLGLERVVLFVPDLESALNLYQSLGFQLLSRNPPKEAKEYVESATLCFPDGKNQLELHTQPSRQFTDLVVRVNNVQALYQRLQHQTQLSWLQTPHPTDQGWEAVVRTPDKNIWVLVSGPA